MDLTSADGDAVDYGPLPRASAGPITERTFAAWINADLLGGTRTIIAPHSDSGGMLMFVSNADTGLGHLRLYSNRYDAALGQWRSTTTTITTGSWFHVAVSYDHSNTTNDPLMWINGVAQSVTEVNTPAGNLNSELGTHVVVGNVNTVTVSYTWGFDGQIFDPRIYDRSFTDTDALTLYNGGVPEPSLVTDGLVFQPFVVRTDRLSEFVDVELDADTKVFENAYRSVGFVHGSPIARAAP
jgi:hypothetical protein